MENLFNTIFPPKCIFCGREGRSFCRVCLNTCLLFTGGVCIVCQEESIDGLTHPSCNKNKAPSMLFSAYVYKDKVKECIKRSKYNSMEFDALKDLSKRAVRYFWKVGYYFPGYVVVSIPLSRKKYRQRGFNQVDIISKELTKGFALKQDNSVLNRVKYTKAQTGYGRKMRMENLKDAFSASSKVKGKKIMLVDDVCTTGSTLLEASKALYNAGAEDVKCFTVARATI